MGKTIRRQIVKFRSSKTEEMVVTSGGKFSARASMVAPVLECNSRLSLVGHALNSRTVRVYEREIPYYNVRRGDTQGSGWGKSKTTIAVLWMSTKHAPKPPILLH